MHPIAATTTMATATTAAFAFALTFAFAIAKSPRRDAKRVTDIA
jgi:hypothetical protein